MKNIHVLPTDKPSRLFKDDFGKLIYSINIDQEQNHFFTQNIYITSDEKIKEGDYVIKISSLYKGGGIAQKYSFIDAQFEDIIFKKIILTTDQDLIKYGVQCIDTEFLKWFVKNPSCEWIEVIKIDVEQPKPLYPNGNHKGERVWIEQYKIIIPKEEPNKTHYLDELPNMDKNVLAKMWADAMPKYPIGGYAPGLYSCVCVSCEKEFMGDKRAVQCEPCAIEMVNTKITINDRGGIETVKQQTLEEAQESYLDSPLPHSYKGAVEFGAKWQQERSYSEEEVKDIVEQTIEKFYKHTYSDKTKSEMKELWFENFKKRIA